MPNNQFNGSADQIENNVNKKDVFDPNLSDEAKSIGYPSLKLLVNLIHPVGSFYISSNPTEPSKILVCTWEQIKDVFLLSAGDIYSAGTTGGEAAHKLTVDEMPSHKHKYLLTYSNEGTISKYFPDGSSLKPGNFQNEDYMEAKGGNQPHNNMPPYLAVYMWKRVA